MGIRKLIMVGVSVLFSLLLSSSFGCKSPMERTIEGLGRKVEEDARTTEEATKEYMEILDKMSKGEISPEEAEKRIEAISKETVEKLHLKVEEEE